MVLSEWCRTSVTVAWWVAGPVLAASEVPEICSTRSLRGIIWHGSAYPASASSSERASSM